MQLIINKDLILIKVDKTEKQFPILFEILSKRESEHKISNNKIPNYENHKQFVLSHPYREWFIIKYLNSFIGTTYLTIDNILGIYVFRDQISALEKVIFFILNYYDPLPAIPSVRNKYFQINISSKNKIYKKIIEDLGGKKLQSSYILKDLKKLKPKK